MYKQNKILNQDGQYTPGRDARWREGNDLILNYLKKLEPTKKIKVLDIGCGEGHNYSILTKKMTEMKIPEDSLVYYAIDNNPALESVFEHSKIRFTLGDLSGLEDLYPESFFDVIIASGIREN